MKFRLIYLLFAAALCFIVFPGNKNGRASEAKVGNTGAPGDETNFNGSPRICSYCHFGAAGPVTHINLIDSNGDTVAQYQPGQQYKARVTIDNNNPSITGYGFQMIALRDADSTDVKGFSDPGNNTVNNYKLATINNGRRYAEHDNVSLTNIFDVVWTAPAAGTGPVTFYAAGNGVNRNGTTSGDGADADVLKIEEATQASTGAPEFFNIQMQIWPNPVVQTAQVRVTSVKSGNVIMRVYDVNGQLIQESTTQLNTGLNTLDLPTSGWMKGLYFIEISDGENRSVARLVKA